MSSEVRASPPVRKPTRVLACVLCQQRKVKCDRKFPCAHCTKSRVQCVPSILQPRRRRRRYPERDLLDRIKRYEDLLRQNNINFEPLHKDFASLNLGDKPSSIADNGYGSEDEHDNDDPSPSTTSIGRADREYEPKSMWLAMSRGFGKADDESDSSADEMRETTMKKAWDLASFNDDHLLFGSPQGRIDLSTLHPDPVQIFRLWQAYLDNINPILKVTHTPTLQSRIVDAASHIGNIDSSLEALLFSIYSMAVLSLRQEECLSMFNVAKGDLLTRFQFGCQQALSNASFLRTTERDCLTALFLYCVSRYTPFPINTDRTRYLFVLLLYHSHCRQYSPLLYALLCAWEFTTNLHSKIVPYLRPKCAVDCGGRSCYLILASDRWHSRNRRY